MLKCLSDLPCSETALYIGSVQVAQLSWIERKVAATLFGEPPSATVQDGLKNFLKVLLFSTLPWSAVLSISV